jgi:glutathione S-transferase
VTLISPSEYDSASNLIKVVADISGTDLQVNYDKEKMKAVADKNAGCAPYLETKDGTVLFTRLAIAGHIARMNPGSGLLGATPFEEAKINEWMAWCSTTYLPKCKDAIYPILGQGGKTDMKKFNEGVKHAKEQAKILDTYLKGKQYLVGSSMTLADLYLANSLTLSFQTIFDAGFRKAMPNLAKWFETITSAPAFVKRFGNIKSCAKALKPSEASAPAGKAAAKDDDLDLFGDDDEEDAEAAKKAAAAAKEAAKGKKAKKVVIAQSLVMFEVKPLDSDTDLDALAA